MGAELATPAAIVAQRNEWSIRYGKRRKAIDKALLQDCERRLEAEEQPIPDAANTMSPAGLNHEELNRISRAFGRPLA